MPRGSYVEWSSILAGAVLALAMQTVTSVWQRHRRTMHSPYRTEELTAGGALAIGIWLLWVQVLASFAGGYLSGRMRAPILGTDAHERET